MYNAVVYANYTEYSYLNKNDFIILRYRFDFNLHQKMSNARIGHAIEQQPENLYENTKRSKNNPVNPSSTEETTGSNGSISVRKTTYEIGKENLDQGTEVNPSARKPTQDENRQRGKQPNEWVGVSEACHKAGKQLGGRGTKDNVFIGRKSVNRGDWLAAENQDRKFLNEEKPGEKRKVLLQVIESFGNQNNPQRPTSVQRISDQITNYDDGRPPTITRNELPRESVDNEPSDDRPLT